MAVKAVIAKLEDVPETIRGEYKPGEGGLFFLDLEGIEEHPGTGPLVRAKKREAEARQKIETEYKALKEQAEAQAEELTERLKGVLPKADVERLEKQWGEKLLKQGAEKDTQIKSLSAGLTKLLVDNVAKGLAAELAKSPTEIGLLLPHIRGRLAVDTVDGEHVTRVLDADGKLSAATLDDLKKEFLTNPMFGAVVIGSKASGGSANEAGHASSAPGSVRVDTKANLATLRPKDLAAQLAARAGE